jgi:hypothetical protein
MNNIAEELEAALDFWGGAALQQVRENVLAFRWRGASATAPS